MTTSSNLAINDNILWGNARWIVNAVDSEQITMTNAYNNCPRAFTRTFIESACNEHKLKIIVSNTGITTTRLTPTEQQEANLLLAIAEALSACDSPFSKGNSGDEPNTYNCQIVARKVLDENGFEDRKTPSKSRLGRILTHYRNTGGDFESLVLKTRKKKGKTLPIEVEAIVQRYINEHYLVKNKPSVSLVYAEMLEQAPENLKPLLPSESSFRRRINKLNRGIVILKRQGDAAYKEYMRGCGKKITAENLLERVEMDAMHIVLGVVDDNGNFLGYVTMYFAIDFASRSVVGWHIEVKKKLRGEKTSGVMACIRNMLRTETPHGLSCLFPVGGIPDEIVMDHGTAFANKRIRSLCQSLCISIQYTGTKRGWGKPIAEAFVKYLRSRFFRQIKGYRDSNNIKNLDTKRPEHENCVKLSELKIAAEDFVHNGYQKRKHSSLELDTPQNVWDRLYPKLPPRQADIFDSQLFKTEHTSRKLHQVRGITLEYQTFQCPKLKRWFVELDTEKNRSQSIPMDVYFDPNDASEIVVIHPETGECLTVPNVIKSKVISKSFIEANAKRVANKQKEDESDNCSSLAKLSSNPKSKNKRKRSHSKVPLDDGSKPFDMKQVLDEYEQGFDEDSEFDEFDNLDSDTDEEWGFDA